MAKEKSSEDSLYWQVERECLRLQALVSMSHASKGNRTVMLTGRKMTGEQREELNASMVEVISTK
jgi:hypothetical protein